MHQPTISSRESIVSMLRACEINPTHQRIEIAQVLFDQRRHLCADQILDLVNARHTETSKATVYNALKLFVEKRLVRQLVVDPDKIFYDPNTEPHHHFYNVVTGQLTDIPASGIRIDNLPALPENLVEDGIDIVIRTRPASERSHSV